MIEKSCRTCGRPLPISAFVKNVHSADGYRASCKECVKVGATRPPHLAGTKTCRTCKQELPYSSFRRQKLTSDGYRASCKECVKSGNSVRPVIQTDTTRRCGRCHEFKPIEEFRRLTKYPNRTYPYCKVCGKAYARENSAKNRPARKHLAKAYNSRPEVRERARQAAMTRLKKIRADPELNALRLEKIREKNKRRYARNPERYIAANAEARAKRRLVPGSFSDKDIQGIYKSQKGCCLYCGKRVGRKAGIKSAIDHFIPISKGGTNMPDNLVLSCFSCNSKKSNKMPWDFMPDRFAPPESQAAD